MKHIIQTFAMMLAAAMPASIGWSTRPASRCSSWARPAKRGASRTCPRPWTSCTAPGARSEDTSSPVGVYQPKLASERCKPCSGRCARRPPGFYEAFGGDGISQGYLVSLADKYQRGSQKAFAVLAADGDQPDARLLYGQILNGVPDQTGAVQPGTEASRGEAGPFMVGAAYALPDPASEFMDKVAALVPEPGPNLPASMLVPAISNRSDSYSFGTSMAGWVQTRLPLGAQVVNTFIGVHLGNSFFVFLGLVAGYFRLLWRLARLFQIPDSDLVDVLPEDRFLNAIISTFFVSGALMTALGIETAFMAAINGLSAETPVHPKALLDRLVGGGLLVGALSSTIASGDLGQLGKLTKAKVAMLGKNWECYLLSSGGALPGAPAMIDLPGYPHWPEDSDDASVLKRDV